jgi:hypothetical protein
MTPSDPTDTEIEAVARAMYEARHKGIANCWAWDDQGLDDEHPHIRGAILRDAKAAIKVIDRIRSHRAQAPSDSDAVKGEKSDG